jgi:tol-pal system protein YbgF
MNTPRIQPLVGACLLGALLLATALPASAQRASLSERITALEQQAANNQGNVDLLNQVNGLKAEVRTLQSQLEELQHQQQQWHDSSRNQYLDLDGRLNRLEGGGAPAPTAPASAPVEPPAAAAASIEQKPAVYGDPGALAKGEGERAAYDAAFDVLKAGRYDESARMFQEFLQQYPNGAWAPNALYWLGESYYVTQNYQLAQQQVQALLDRYPTHDKAPGALLKVGLSQYGLKQLDAAQATLAQVVQLYPGTDAARTADDRLRAIQLNALR